AELCAITRDAGEGCELSAWVEDRRRTTVDGLPAFLAGLAPRYRTFEPLTVSVLRVRAWASRLDPGCRNCALDPRACPGASSVHRHKPLQSGEVSRLNMARHTFFCIDGHTCGNPVRPVAGGAPFLKGTTMIEKRAHFLT